MPCKMRWRNLQLPVNLYPEEEGKRLGALIKINCDELLPYIQSKVTEYL